MNLYQFQAVTDSVTECDCCGRSNLKKTMVLLDVETGDEKYFGTACGAKALSWSTEKATKRVKAEWSKLTQDRRNAIASAKYIARQPWGALFAEDFFHFYDQGKLEYRGCWYFGFQDAFDTYMAQEIRLAGFTGFRPHSLGQFCLDTLRASFAS